MKVVGKRQIMSGKTIGVCQKCGDNFIIEREPMWYWIRTDHPNHPNECHLGDYGLFREREVAERICAAWNSYGSEHTYPFYVVEVFPLEMLAEEQDDTDSPQMGLW